MDRSVKKIDNNNNKPNKKGNYQHKHTQPERERTLSQQAVYVVELFQPSAKM